MLGVAGALGHVIHSIWHDLLSATIGALLSVPLSVWVVDRWIRGREERQGRDVQHLVRTDVAIAANACATIARRALGVDWPPRGMVLPDSSPTGIAAAYADMIGHEIVERWDVIYRERARYLSDAARALILRDTPPVVERLERILDRLTAAPGTPPKWTKAVFALRDAAKVLTYPPMDLPRLGDPQVTSQDTEALRTLIAGNLHMVLGAAVRAQRLFVEDREGPTGRARGRGRPSA